jgi:hypothetical protein
MLGGIKMQTITSIFMIIALFFNSLFAGLPILAKAAENPNYKWNWMLTEAQIVTVDNYREIYNKYASQPAAYPDKTTEYQSLLDENLNTARKWRSDFPNGKIQFYHAVSNDGIWDYKLPNRFLPWFDENGNFSAYNIDMNGEILGNINYGFAGAATGFTPVTIFAGGGYLAIKNQTAKWTDYYYYFDEKDDHQWIAFGIMLYSLVDPDYSSEVAPVDVALSLTNPKAASAAYVTYMNMQSTPDEKAKAFEHINALNSQIKNIVLNDYDLIRSVAESK